MATDGRYFNQASKQIDKNWELLKQGIQDVPTWQDWSVDEAAGGKVVGADPTLLLSSQAKKLAEKIKKSGGGDLVAITENLVDIVWGKDRPANPAEPVNLLPEKYSGKDTKTKLSELRKDLEKKNSAGFVVSMLDETAWLFNLRGSDIPYNPVFFSYAIVTPETATLYVDSSKLSDECQKYLADNDVTVKPYDSIFGDARALSASLATSGEIGPESTEDKKPSATPKTVSISTKASWALKLALGGDELVEEIRSPIGDAKSIKNDTELDGMRQCHIRDGAALNEFFAWLEDQIVNKKVEVDEVAAADKLEQLRSTKKDFVGLSFPTISSSGPK